MSSFREAVAPAEQRPATAYSYLRLSSSTQANRANRETYKDGFRRQIELRDEYLKANPHLTLDTSLTLHDVGVSGYTGANAVKGGPGKLGLFRAMVETGRVKPGSYLLVESLDRMSRAQVNDALELLLSLVNRNIIVVTLVDGMVYKRGADATQFLISIVHMMRSHEESLMKSKRLRAAWVQKRASATERKLTRRAPAWLKLVGNEFEPIPDRVAVVHRILTELANGIGREKIAARLNRDAIPCWGHGRQWHGGTVQKITQNLALLGYFQPHRLVYEEIGGIQVARRVPTGKPISDYYPAIVDNDMWFRARRIADARARPQAPNSGGRQGTVISNLFGTIASCGLCGSPLTYRDRGPRSTPVLRCSAERGGACSNAYRYPYQLTENIVLTWALDVDMAGANPSEIQALEDEQKARRGRRDALQSQGEKIVAELGFGNRFAKARLDTLEMEISRVEAEFADIDTRLATLKMTVDQNGRVPAIQLLIDLILARAPESEVYSARAKIRQILRDNIKSMVCDPDGFIEVKSLDGRSYRFKDGYWQKDGKWLPSSFGFFGFRPVSKAEATRQRNRGEASSAPSH